MLTRVAGTLIAVAGGPVFWLGVKGMTKGVAEEEGKEREGAGREVRWDDGESAVDEESGAEDAVEEGVEEEVEGGRSGSEREEDRQRRSE